MEQSKEYKKATDMILKSNFSVKSVKTFWGRDGVGVNANMYYNNKKIGSIIDSGNGGPLDIYYDHRNEYKQVVKDFLFTLPKSDDQHDQEDLWNELINEYLLIKDFKKAMKKIQILHNNEVFTFKKDNKPSRLDRMYNYKGNNRISFREVVMDRWEQCIILNDLSHNKALSLFKTHCID